MKSVSMPLYSTLRVSKQILHFGFNFKTQSNFKTASKAERRHLYPNSTARKGPDNSEVVTDILCFTATYCLHMGHMICPYNVLVMMIACQVGIVPSKKGNGGEFLYFWIFFSL